MNCWKDTRVLVAGGTGTIGIPLVSKLINHGAEVKVVSIDSPKYAKTVFSMSLENDFNKVRFLQKDLTKLENCIEVTQDQDCVFNLIGIKGSTGIGETKVASYLVPMLWFQTNLMEASFRNDIDRYLFTSSICGYPQSKVPKEEDTIWNGMPKQNDRIPGIAKRVGEIQGEAYMLEYGWKAVRIVRPSNVYGPFDDFNPETAQVIPSLINRVFKGENPLKVWGDGSAIRDFIYSKDVAYWMTIAMENAPPCLPINIGSGKGVTIKEIVEIILDYASEFGYIPDVEWDVTKPSGDHIRVLSMERAKKILNYNVITNLKDGIRRTIDWYVDNRDFVNNKYGVDIGRSMLHEK